MTDASYKHTANHAHCLACESARVAATSVCSFSELNISQASEIWLSDRADIQEATRKNLENCALRLIAFFGELKLSELHIGHLREYRAFRQEHVKPDRINKELGLLRSLLKAAGLWTPMQQFYRPMRSDPADRGMALEPEEERHLFRVAAANPRWLVAYCSSVISRNTTAGPGEIRHLRMKNVDREHFGWIRIEERVKNRFRIRTLPCNEDAAWALEQLIRRAKEKGAVEPEHYLLPHRGTGDGADPTRPQGSWKKAWGKLRDKAAVRFPRIKRMRFYDCRHTACTTLLQDPSVPYNAIEHFMGHRLGSQTKRKYDHIRDETLKLGANALASGHVERRYAEEMVERVPPRGERASPFVVKKGVNNPAPRR